MRTPSHLVIAALVGALCACFTKEDGAARAPTRAGAEPRFEYKDTRDLVALVTDAARLVSTDGEAAFSRFAIPNSRWRQDETYIFVLDPEGNMVVHPDPALQGKNDLGLTDINGRPIIRGLIHAATAVPGRPYGWYHYEWPVPEGLLARWKSSYVQLVTAPSGKRYIVGSGMYNDRMERAFVVDMVDDAAAQLEKRGEAAFPLLRDPTGPFRAKDAYVFVVDASGVELVNPAFPNLEGRPLLDVKDTEGKPLVREMFGVINTRGAGWVDYMWPKPGESVSTQKSTYVRRVKVGDRTLLVGAGVYLADAPKAPPDPRKPTAAQLMALVDEAAALFAQRGDAAYPVFRERDSKWFHDDTYVFVWTLDGVRRFHAADPGLEGKSARGAKDILGRPYGQMMLDVATSPSGQGWVHYMYPEPGSLFPAWKSAFVKRVRSPSGTDHLVGSGIYNMQLDKAFIVDVVDRAAALIEARGKAAFPMLRDKTGPFVFMDTYVFVSTPDGVELVNPAQPSTEGRNILDVRDVRGKRMVRDYIAAAMRGGAAWVDYHWYKPGQNTPARKQTFVRKVVAPDGTYVVGSGLYSED